MPVVDKRSLLLDKDVCWSHDIGSVGTGIVGKTREHCVVCIEIRLFAYMKLREVFEIGYKMFLSANVSLIASSW